jgi:hypothetical protein
MNEIKSEDYVVVLYLPQELFDLYSSYGGEKSVEMQEVLRAIQPCRKLYIYSLDSEPVEFWGDA